MPTSLPKLVLTLLSALVLFGVGVLVGISLSKHPDPEVRVPKLGRLPDNTVVVEETSELPSEPVVIDSVPTTARPREILRTVTVPGKPDPETVRALAEALFSQKLDELDLPLDLDLSFRVSHDLKRFETEKETGWTGTGSCEFFSKKRDEWVVLVSEEIDEDLSVAKKVVVPPILTKHAVTLEGSYGSGGWGSEVGYERRLGGSRLWVGGLAGADEEFGWRVGGRLRVEWN